MESTLRKSLGLALLSGTLLAAGCGNDDGELFPEETGQAPLEQSDNISDQVERRDAPEPQFDETPAGAGNAQATNGRDSSPRSPRSETPQQAVALVSPLQDSDARGTVIFTQQDDGILVETNLSGLAPGLHGFHVHEFGDCSASDGSSAGDHFAPHDREHGDPNGNPGERHVGDLGNIEADNSGAARHSMVDQVIAFDGTNSILGKAIIIHSGEDDLSSQPSGEAGQPVACGVIQSRDELTQQEQAGDGSNSGQANRPEGSPQQEPQRATGQQAESPAMQGPALEQDHTHRLA